MIKIYRQKGIMEAHIIAGDLIKLCLCEKFGPRWNLRRVDGDSITGLVANAQLGDIFKFFRRVEKSLLTSANR